jgi:fumarate reductase flavoprotein subunit
MRGQVMSYESTSNIETLQTGILIIGGGGGGLAAAVAAAEKGADVFLLEKRRTVGGNASSAGGIFAAESCAQDRLGIDSGRDAHFKAAMSHSHWKTDPRIIRTFIDKSGDTIHWLEEKGLKFDVPVFYPNLPRTIHLPQGHGAEIVKALVKKCEDLGVQLFLETAAKRILVDNMGDVIGVLGETNDREFKVNAKSIIIATGGYGGNKELLKKYYSFYTEDLYSIGLPHMGDGLLMTMEIGGATEGLGILQLRGPYFRGALEGVVAAMQPNTIWVNKKGERFVDEGTTFYWPEAANALNRQPDMVCYALFDEKTKEGFIEKGITQGFKRFRSKAKLTELGRILQSEEAKGQVKIADSWEEISRWIGAASTVLRNTVTEYNSFCDQKDDKMFAKDHRYLVPLLTPPYYALQCYQSFFGTMGGIKINHHMEVLNHSGDPIPGLYAAGNDTGGWVADTYSLILPGTTFGFAINSGRIAGENAAQYILRK